MPLIDWLNPNSMSPGALALLDCTLDRCFDGIRLTKEDSPGTLTVLSAETSRLEARSDANQARTAANGRGVSLGEVLRRLISDLTESGEQCAAQAMHLVAKCKTLIGSGRRLLRSARRLSSICWVGLSFNFGAASSMVREGSIRSLVDSTAGLKKGVVRNISPAGVSLSLPATDAEDVCVGSLAATICLQNGDITLGIVRVHCLRYDRQEWGELGIETLTGPVSAFPAIGVAADRSAEYMVRSILVLEEAGYGNDDVLLSVLIPKGLCAREENLRLRGLPVLLEKTALLETGADFELHLWRIREGV